MCLSLGSCTTFFLSNSLICLSFFQSNLGSAGGPLQRMCRDCGKLLGLILKLCAVIYSPWFIHSTFLHALQGGYFGSRPGLIKIYVPCLYQTWSCSKWHSYSWMLRSPWEWSLESGWQVGLWKLLVSLESQVGREPSNGSGIWIQIHISQYLHLMASRHAVYICRTGC